MIMIVAAATMNEVLTKKHPNRFDIPSETEIQMFITAESSTRKNGKEIDGGRRQPKRARYRMSPLYIYYLMKRFNETRGEMKPAQAVSYLKDVCDTSADDFPPDKQIKAKVSAIRSKFKARMRLPDIPDVPSRCL